MTTGPEIFSYWVTTALFSPEVEADESEHKSMYPIGASIRI